MNKPHAHIQRRNQQVNRRHIKLTYLLTASEPAQGNEFLWKVAQTIWLFLVKINGK